MTIEEMQKRKKELGYTNQQLAELTGVPLGTLQKIFSGATKAPRFDTIQALEKVLSKTANPHAVTYNFQSSSSEFKEPAFDYHARRTGGYTLEDYLRLPDDIRVELIDGVFYDMAAPTTIHQSISGFIYKLLLDHVLAHGGECMSFVSPVDVQLDMDDKTVVQPDVLIVCDHNKFKNGRVFGAPDFLVEVLSPSTKKKDLNLKMWKYSNAGVREYWIVDPEKRVTIVYDLEHNEIPVIYDADEKVPVGIWNGECMIDFKQIYDHMGFLYDT